MSGNVKVEKVPPIPIRPTFRIELSERDAEIIRALVGGINRGHNSEASVTVMTLYQALTSAGVGALGGETFSDLFSGAVACK